MVINDQKFGSISENTLITIPTTATFTISNVQSNTIILIEKESIFHEIKNNKNLQI